MSTPNFSLRCGHTVYWYGDDKARNARLGINRQAPPSTLWCRECKKRIITA